MQLSEGEKICKAAPFVECPFRKIHDIPPSIYTKQHLFISQVLRVKIEKNRFHLFF